MYTPSDARAEPHKATPAIARAAKRNGVSIHEGCAVRGIEMQAGRLAGVVTEKGVIRTSVALCAAGAWASMFCRSLSIRLPQLQVRGTVVRTAPGSQVLDGNLFSDLIGIRKRQDGGYTVAHGSILDHSITPSTIRFSWQFLPALMTEINVLRLSLGKDFVDELRAPITWALDKISPFEMRRVLDPEPNPRVVREIRANLAKAFPALADIDFVESWAGMVETTPDVIPIMGEAESIPGFFIATGFSGHGFGIGPGAGRAMASLLTGAQPDVDISELRLSRFSDGSKVRPQPGF
jgi:glycine/D-amino acid oxidase-like deaminating enzyme